MDLAWKEFKANDGRSYYYNTITKETQWMAPSGFGKVNKAPMPLPPTPPANKPVLVQDEDVYENSSSIKDQILALKKKKQEEEKEWTEQTVDGGKSYFFNPRTRKSTWSKPESMSEEDAGNNYSKLTGPVNPEANAEDEDLYQNTPTIREQVAAASAGASSASGTKSGPPVPVGKPRNSVAPSAATGLPAANPPANKFGSSTGKLQSTDAGANNTLGRQNSIGPSKPRKPGMVEEPQLTDYEEDLYQNLTSRSKNSGVVTHGLLGALSGGGTNSTAGASSANQSYFAPALPKNNPPTGAMRGASSQAAMQLPPPPSAAELDNYIITTSKANEADAFNRPYSTYSSTYSTTSQSTYSNAYSPNQASSHQGGTGDRQSVYTYYAPRAGERLRHANINQLNVVVDADHSVLIAVKKSETIRDMMRLVESQYSLLYPFDPKFQCKAIKDQDSNPIGLNELVSSLVPNSTVFVEKSPEIENEEMETSGQAADGAGKRKLRVRTIAGDIKTILVDEAAPVKHIMPQIAGKMGMINFQEFGLLIYRVEKLEKNDTRRKFFTAIGGISKVSRKPNKGKTEEVDPADEDSLWIEHWLNMNESLSSQGIKMTEDVYLKRRFYFFDDSVYQNDHTSLELCFHQAKQGVLNGENPCTLQQAVSFAALQCQVTFGNYDKALVTFNDKTLSEILPSEYIKAKKIDKTIMEEYIKLKGYAGPNAMFLYMQLYNALDSYGISKFFGVEASQKKKKLEPVFIGVSCNDILRFDFKANEIECKYPLKFVHHYSTTPEYFKLYFGETADMVLCMSTVEARQISALLEGYTQFILAKTAANQSG